MTGLRMPVRQTSGCSFHSILLAPGAIRNCGLLEQIWHSAADDRGLGEMNTLESEWVASVSRPDAESHHQSKIWADLLLFVLENSDDTET